MKTSHYLLLCAALFVAGCSLAWLIRQNRSSGACGASQARVLSPSPKPAKADRVGDTLRRKVSPREKPSTNSVVREKSADIVKTDYQRRLEALLKQAGIRGLGEPERSQFMQLVFNWVAADPDAALSWVLGLRNPSDARMLFSAIIGNLADKDVAGTLAIAKKYRTAQGRGLDMPPRLLPFLETLDAREFLRITSLFSGGSGTFSCPVNFAKGFDYRQALDGLVEMEAGRMEKNTNPSFIPSNLLEEWAKRDWNAAWEWTLSGKRLMNNSVADLVESLMPNADTDEIAKIAALIAGVPNRAPKENYDDAYAILAKRPSQELVARFVDQAPGGRTETLVQLFARALQSTGGPYDTLRGIVLTQMTPAERIAAFHQDFVRKSLWCDDIRASCTALLRQLGHSKQEIEQMLPATREP